MATEQLSSDWAPENFFETTLSADATDSDTDIFLSDVPTQSEGTLVINPDSTTSREIIYYNSKTATKVTCPSAALGRGYDNTTATSHTSGTKVIMAPIADWFNSLKTLFTTTPGGWTSLADTPDIVTNNGNRSYDLVFNTEDHTDVLSKGMRIRTTRTTAAPDQCADLEESSSQYFSKSSPTGITFTTAYTIMGWIKLESYTGALQGIALRLSASQGWALFVNASGQLVVYGRNSSDETATSYQSVPLGRWVHVAASHDVSGNTSAIYIDGVEVPSTRTGSISAIVQPSGESLEIGGAGESFDGKMCQIGIFDAVISESNIRDYMTHGLSGSETNCVGAWSLDNSLTDLNSNGNDLTANGGADYSNDDSPFGDRGTSTTLDYGVVTDVSFSTNTTVTVQVPEGCTIDTSGGISAVSYSTNSSPYGFVRDKGRWEIIFYRDAAASYEAASATGSWQHIGSGELVIPVGAWEISWRAGMYCNETSGTSVNIYASLSTSTSAETLPETTTITSDQGGSTNRATINSTGGSTNINLSSATSHYLITRSTAGDTIRVWQSIGGDIKAKCAYL